MTRTEANEESFISPNKIIFKKYRPIKLIAEGIFSQIYLVINERTNQSYLMKIEKQDSKNQLLEYEAYYLYSLKGIGIPELITFGKIKNYNILIEELLDKSLYTLFLENNELSIQDICLIAIQLINRIEWIHSKTLIHRDIKPENVFIGKNKPNIIYLIQFGLCTKYCSSKTGKHILPGFRGTFTGTLKFSSANAQRGNQQSRRDDIESLGYTILFLMKKSLPWENLNRNFNEKDVYLKTYAMKKYMPLEKLCKGAPTEMQDYFKYVRNMKFQVEPNYDYLRELFFNILKKNGCENLDNISFSWEDKSQLPQSKKRKKTVSPKAKLFSKIQKKIELEPVNNINSIVNSNDPKKNRVQTTILRENNNKIQPILKDINYTNNNILKPNLKNTFEYTQNQNEVNNKEKEKENIKGYNENEIKLNKDNKELKKNVNEKNISNRNMLYNGKMMYEFNNTNNTEEPSNSKEEENNNHHISYKNKMMYNIKQNILLDMNNKNNDIKNPNLQFNNINPNVNVYNFNIYNNRYSSTNNNIKKPHQIKNTAISNMQNNN
jgi:serine/threonine protein kinase